MPSYWEPSPQEALENTELALMGHQWAADDENPLEQFVHKLHGMFLAVLRAKKEKEDEEGLLFPVERRKAQVEPLPVALPATPPDPRHARRMSPQLGPCPEI